MIQILLNSLIDGLAIGVIALAFTLVYRPTGVFFLALGGIYSLVPHFTLALIDQGLHWTIASVASVLLGVLVACGCEFASHSRLERKQTASINHLVSSLGIYIVLVQLTVLIWGSNTKVFRQESHRVFRFGGLLLTDSQLVTAFVLLISLGTLAMFMKKTRLGLLLRGLTQNPTEMKLLGHPVPVLRLLTFGVSGSLVALVSLTLANDVGFDPFGGIAAILLGIVAVVIGGRDSFVGPVVGGIILSLVRSMATWYAPKWQEAVTFLLLGFFLLFVPKGIFSRGMRMEADS